MPRTKEKAVKAPLANGAAGKKQPQANAQPAVCYASKEAFEKALRKTTELHAGLFKRLAE